MKKITQFLTQLFQHLGFQPEEVDIKTLDNEDKIIIDVEVPEKDVGIVIGRGGETLTAIQQLLRLVFGREVDKKIILDVNDYQKKRVEKIKKIAKEVSERVAITKKTEKLNLTLSAYERYLVHQFISDEFKELKSYSVGEGRLRRVVIRPKTEDE